MFSTSLKTEIAATLAPGEAIVYHDQLDKPALVRVPNIRPELPAALPTQASVAQRFHRLLSANAEWLREHPRAVILIEGHCDDRGTNEYNLALGNHRAESALKYLLSQGVARTRMTTISYGEERPLCTEETEECWAQNRRAHFLVKRQ